MYKTIKSALELDRDSRTTFWNNDIEKEMKNVMIAFEFPDDGKAHIGSNGIEVNMILILNT